MGDWFWWLLLGGVGAALLGGVIWPPCQRGTPLPSSPQQSPAKRAALSPAKRAALAQKETSSARQARRPTLPSSGRRSPSVRESTRTPARTPGTTKRGSAKRNSAKRDSVLPRRSYRYPWRKRGAGGERLAQRFAPPPGFRRVSLAPNSFGDWLRYLPLKAKGSPVLLHNGQRKKRQDVHLAVVDLDVGKRDLQQCADAIMRLRAEYLWSIQKAQDLVFNFASGDPARWRDWRRGLRPRVRGRQVTWRRRRKPSNSYRNFRRYLIIVFNYANTYSLARQLKKIKPTPLRPGDALIQGGFPGHAVLILDQAIHPSGQKRYLLGQSFMPAQEFHVLKDPLCSSKGLRCAWYDLQLHLRKLNQIKTPEWTFQSSHARRF